MPELRKDPVTGRWVIISTDRQKRPNDFRFDRAATIGRDQCPFCPGRESLTPPEVLSYRQHGGSANTPGWDVRVVPNKFPALQVEGTLDREGEGIFDRMNGIGAHEVIVETPDHGRTLASMSEPEIERILSAYRDRMLDLKQDRRLRHILIFKNHGAAAGTTLEHSHSQLIALPIVPDFVREEIEGARRHHEHRERCIFCDIVMQERKERSRLVLENEEFVVFAPWAPRSPFETWIVPKRHESNFEAEPKERLGYCAQALRSTLKRLGAALGDPPYNFIVHSNPLRDTPSLSYHWHIEVMPALTHVAGFEWGSGFHINPVPPEEAAEFLRLVIT